MRYADCIVALDPFPIGACFPVSLTRGASYDKVWLQDAHDYSKIAGSWVRLGQVQDKQSLRLPPDL